MVLWSHGRSGSLASTSSGWGLDGLTDVDEANSHCVEDEAVMEITALEVTTNGTKRDNNVIAPSDTAEDPGVAHPITGPPPPAAEGHDVRSAPPAHPWSTPTAAPPTAARKGESPWHSPAEPGSKRRPAGTGLIRTHDALRRPARPPNSTCEGPARRRDSSTRRPLTPHENYRGS
jgi:hypothetical protein